MTMGASVQWYSVDNQKPSAFPYFNYGVEFNEQNSEKVMMGEWTWETGMNYDQITDFERIRDYGLLVVYSNWSFLKNNMKENSQYRNRKLGWVAYVSGKRESRRLMGEVVGMATSICKKYGISPRTVYHSHLPELKKLMEEGTGQKGLPNNQQYNEGGTLKEQPVVK